MMTKQIKSEDLEKFCNDFINIWRKTYIEESYEECLKLSSEFIKDLKPIYKNRGYGENEEAGNCYTYIYLLLMSAKAFEDIIKLAELTKDKSWPADTKKTELIWQVLWDAKERLDVFSSHCLDEGIINDLYKQLKELELYFYDCFGRGIYMSPVIRIKKAKCSICNLNIKGCEHIPGNIYLGNPCRGIAEDIEFTGADMVLSPYDMRCRIWPWNFIEKNRVNARIMNLNQLDKFIDE